MLSVRKNGIYEELNMLTTIRFYLISFQDVILEETLQILGYL